MKSFLTTPARPPDVSQIHGGLQPFGGLCMATLAAINLHLGMVNIPPIEMAMTSKKWKTQYFYPFPWKWLETNRVKTCKKPKFAHGWSQQHGQKTSCKPNISQHGSHVVRVVVALEWSGDFGAYRMHIYTCLQVMNDSKNICLSYVHPNVG